jgi:hypothetical protein
VLTLARLAPVRDLTTSTACVRSPSPACSPSDPKGSTSKSHSISELLQQAGCTIRLRLDKITTIDGLYRYAATYTITEPPNVRTAT